MRHGRGLNAGNFRGVKGLIPKGLNNLSCFLLLCWWIANLHSGCDPKLDVLLSSVIGCDKGSTSSLVSIPLIVSIADPWGHGLWSHQKAHCIYSCPFPIQHFSCLWAPSLDFCFSLIYHILPLYLLICIPTFPSQSCPEEILRKYFPSKADLFNGKIYCFIANRTHFSSCKNFFHGFIDPFEPSFSQLPPTF